MKQDLTLRRQKRKGTFALLFLPSPHCRSHHCCGVTGSQLPQPVCCRTWLAPALVEPLPSPVRLMQCPEAYTAKQERFCLAAHGRVHSRRGDNVGSQQENDRLEGGPFLVTVSIPLEGLRGRSCCFACVILD